tara:strand:+ start:1256 stop:3016 length:1761 start_codon:yes stop_codon:yes gene_type:complete
MTSVNTQRIHLNTNDAELVDGNHANATFNLAKANLQCLCNQELSISLVKAVLPITIDAFGYNDDDTVAFTMKIIDSSFTDQILKCFITKDTYDIPPYAATRPTVFKFPVSYLESPLSIQDILNKILASQYSGSSNVSLIILKDSKRTAVQFDSGTITELVFDNSYVVKGRTNYNKPAQRLFTALGINTYDGEDVGGLVPTETIFKGGNGGIDSGTNVFFQYQLSLYHPPINLVSNLMLDSASSNGGGARNNILAGIQIDVEDQSRVMECTHIGGDAPPDPSPSIFNGVPADTNSAISLTGNLIMFIKDYKYYIHNISANTTDVGVDFGAATSILTEIPTGLVSWMTMRLLASDQIRMLFSDGNVYLFSFTISNNIPTFTFDLTTTQFNVFGGTGSYSVGLPLSGEIDTGGFNAESNQWYKWDGTTTNAGGNCVLTASTYGGVGQDFVGLASDLDSAYVDISDATKGYAFKGSNYYELSFTNGVNATEATLGRVITGGTLVSSGTITVSSSVSSPSVSSSATGTTVLVSKSSSLINHINHSVGNSHKIVSANSVSNLTLILENDSGGEKYSDSNIYYEIEFKTYDSI